MKFQQFSFAQIRIDGIEYGYDVVIDIRSSYVVEVVGEDVDRHVRHDFCDVAPAEQQSF